MRSVVWMPVCGRVHTGAACNQSWDSSKGWTCQCSDRQRSHRLNQQSRSWRHLGVSSALCDLCSTSGLQLCHGRSVLHTHTHFIFKLLNIFLITLPTRLNLQDAVVLTERHVSPPSSVWCHYWSHSSTAAPQIISSLRHVRRNSLILRKRQRADSALYDCCQTGRNIELSQSHNWENTSGSDSSSE